MSSTGFFIPLEDSLARFGKVLLFRVLPVELAGAIYARVPQLCSRVLGLAFSTAYASQAADFATALNPLRVGQGLTVKQEAYAQARFEGNDGHDSYMIAFKPEGWKRSSVTDAAYLLDRDHRILARVAQLRAERMKHSSLLPFLSPEFVTDGIMRIAMTGEKESNRLNAYVHLGKVAGIDLFREPTRVERVDRTAEDVDRELKAKLQTLMNGMTIEGSASSVPASPAAAAKPTPAGAKVDRRRKPVAR